MKQTALELTLAPVPGFDNFCAGPNEAVLRHLQLWASGDARSPVPIYLWGESGSGKTHLLSAVSQALRARGAAVGWLEPTQAEPPAFDPTWQLIVLDDVERYSAVQQHAAFNWFVHAQTLQRGVLAAGACAPSALQLRDDLRTRLGWGHVFEVKLLAEDERRQVLRQQAQQRGWALRDEVLDFMLSRFTRDLGHLSQLLAALDRYALDQRRAITIPLIKEMLNED